MQTWRHSTAPSIAGSASSGERTVGYPHDSSVVLDDSREEEKLRMAAEDSSKGSHWVLVGRIDTHISQTSLADMFYQFGAVESFVAWDTAHCCKKGFVRFLSGDLAALAVAKMHDFIPCRQSQPISVQAVPAAVVADAKFHPAVPSASDEADRPGSVVHLACLATSSPQNVAHRIQALADPAETTREICAFVGKSSAQRLKKLADACGALLPSWPLRTSFQCALSRGLFELLVGAACDPADAKSAGLFLAYLFRSGFLPGHPLDLAVKLLRAVRRAADLDGVCLFVEELCGVSGDDHAAAAAFWALVGDMAATHPVPAVQEASVAKLRQRLRRSSLGDAPPRMGGGSPPSHASRRRADDSRSRTVYFSHLSPAVTNSQLMQFLGEVGVVAKVRRCVDSSHSNHFGFVELASMVEAQRLIARDRTRLAGAEVRLQPARSAVLDVDPTDAVAGVDGVAGKPCVFGR